MNLSTVTAAVLAAHVSAPSVSKLAQAGHARLPYGHASIYETVLIDVGAAQVLRIQHGTTQAT